VLEQRKFEDEPTEKGKNNAPEEWFKVFCYFRNKLERELDETEELRRYLL